MRRDPFLLTPGPLTTSRSTKEAMLHDWGSRDTAFIAMTARVRRRLADIAGGGDLYPGKLTVADSFRVGCIGRLGEDEMRGVLAAMRAVLDEMGVADCSPKVTERMS